MNQNREEVAAIVSGSEDNESATDFTNNFENLSVSSSSSSLVQENENEENIDDFDDDDDEPFYDSKLDDEDEDFVHRFMRGLTKERETCAKTSNNNSEKPVSKEERNNDGEPVFKKSGIAMDENATNNEKIPLKARDSDAVLSCPCCFTTVCMDCQQHEKYNNQYRAMFVMNIGVNWHRKMIFNEENSILEDTVGTTIIENNTKSSDTPISTENKDDVVCFYYPVFCSNCGTEVAALNMDDEVYHFYGCIASG